MADVGASMQVRGGCPHDCPDTCAWTIQVVDGVATQLRGDPEHPFTSGGLCAKVNHYLEDRVYSPDRVLHPLRRTGAKGTGQFERVSWDQALADIARRTRQIIDESGAEAVLPYSYLGTQGLVQGMSLHARFFARLGASRLERTVCGDNGDAGLLATIGTRSGIDPEDLAHSRLIIIWGTNTVVTNIHLWSIVQRARRAGATIVVIDPLLSRTAQAADWHVRPLPGSDAALALGMMHVIVTEGLHDARYIAEHTVGFDRLCERLEHYSPARASQLTGISRDEIAQLARLYATTRPAAIRVLVGMAQHHSAAQIYRAIGCLPAIVGAWRDRGGGLVGITSDHMRRALALAKLAMPELERPDTRSINMVEIGRALTDETLRPPVRALYVYGSNPAVIAPNQNLVLQGLRRDDLFTVVHEHFMTDTARHADYVLPATTEAEHFDVLFSWGHDYVTVNLPAIAPRGEAVSNTELFRRLARAMGLDDEYLHQSDEQLARTVLDSGHPWLHGISLEVLKERGWAKLRLPEDWRPFMDGDFPTPSGKCELYSQTAAELGFDPLPAYEPAAESLAGNPELAVKYPLMLLTPKSALHFLNSSYSGVARHLKAEREPILDIHPDDARPRHINDGDVVRVFNDRGVVELRARIGDRVRPGVVSMPSGWWAVWSRTGQSANALTADTVAPWGRGGVFHDALVEVSRTAQAGDTPISSPSTFVVEGSPP